MLVCAQHHGPPPEKPGAYCRALARDLGVCDPTGNLSVSPAGLFARTAFPAESLVLALPPKFVITVQEALGSGGGRYINQAALLLPRTLPRHFVLAVWVLHQKHVAKAASVWKDWLRAARHSRAYSATIFWSDEELALLEEERLISRTRARRESLRREYETMVEVLLEGELGDDVPVGAISAEEYMWAVTVVSSTSLHFADDFPVLTPLLPRFHPYANSEVYEWGDETNPGAALYVASSIIAPLQEVTVGDSQWNDDLLLHGGYLWDDLEVAHTWLRLSAGDRAGAEPGEHARRQLQAEANWTSPMDFSLTAIELPLRMLPWLRLALAPSDELVGALLRDFDAPQSVEREGVVVRTLLTTLDKTLGRFDHSVDEDEAVLASQHRRQSVPERTVLAVTYRKLCKQVLLATRHLVDTHWQSVLARPMQGLARSDKRKSKRKRRKEK